MASLKPDMFLLVIWGAALVAPSTSRSLPCQLVAQSLQMVDQVMARMVTGVVVVG